VGTGGTIQRAPVKTGEINELAPVNTGETIDKMSSPVG
jgi:hypothetical protein